MYTDPCRRALRFADSAILIGRVSHTCEFSGQSLPTEFLERVFELWDTAALELGLRMTRFRRDTLLALPFAEEPLESSIARLSEMALRMRTAVVDIVLKVCAVHKDQSGRGA